MRVVSVARLDASQSVLDTLEKRIVSAQENKQAEKKEEEDLNSEKKSIIETIKIQVRGRH